MAGAQGQYAWNGIMDAIISKWNRIYSQSGHDAYLPAQVLADNEFLLPEAGTALDLACGLGANAIFLAQQGLAVTALDISSVAIEKLTAYATLAGAKYQCPSAENRPSQLGRTKI